MALEFRFPDVGEGIHEGEIVRWLVKEGDRVRPDQPLVEVETDKAVVEIPAPRAGLVVRLGAAEGQKIQVGEVLVVIDDVDEPAVVAAPPPTQPTTPAAASVVGSLDLALTELPPSPEVTQAAPAAASAQNRRVLAIPSARPALPEHMDAHCHRSCCFSGFFSGAGLTASRFKAASNRSAFRCSSKCLAREPASICRAWPARWTVCSGTCSPKPAGSRRLS